MSKYYLSILKARKNDLDIRNTNGTAYEIYYTTAKDKHPYGRWFTGRDKYGDSIIRERRAGLIPKFYNHNYTGTLPGYSDVEFNPRYQYNTTAFSHRPYKTETITPP